MKKIYISEADNRSYGHSSDVFGGKNYVVEVSDDFNGGAVEYDKLSGKWISDSLYIRTHADDVHDAKNLRDKLKSDAEAVMSGWVLDLNLGLITDEDKNKLITWRDYVKKLDAVELDMTPDIIWPKVPCL